MFARLKLLMGLLHVLNLQTLNSCWRNFNFIFSVTLNLITNRNKKLNFAGDRLHFHHTHFSRIQEFSGPLHPGSPPGLCSCPSGASLKAAQAPCLQHVQLVPLRLRILYLFPIGSKYNRARISLRVGIVVLFCAKCENDERQKGSNNNTACV